MAQITGFARGLTLGSISAASGGSYDISLTDAAGGWAESTDVLAGRPRLCSGQSEIEAWIGEDTTEDKVEYRHRIELLHPHQDDPWAVELLACGEAWENRWFPHTADSMVPRIAATGLPVSSFELEP